MLSKLFIKIPSGFDNGSFVVESEYYGFKFSMNGLVVIERASDIIVGFSTDKELKQNIKTKEKTVLEEDEINKIGELVESILEYADDEDGDDKAELSIGKKTQYISCSDSSLTALIELLSTEDNEFILQNRIADFVAIFNTQNGIKGTRNSLPDSLL